MTVGIYFSRYPQSEDPGAARNEGYLYNDYPQWRNYPHELLKELQKQAGQAVIVCKEETYVGNNTFQRHWLPDARRLGYFNIVERPIIIDTLFDKGYFRKPASFSLVNVPELAVLGRDKAAQNKLFGDLQPKTILATTAEEFEEAIGNMPSELIVVKPPHLNGGRGVAIKPKQELRGQYQALGGGHLIIQQFVDSSAGIAGISGGTHDLRLYIINGEPVFASVRTPKQGSLIANTSQGGSIQFFDVASIPPAAVAVARQVDDYMKQFGNRYYSVDLVNQAKKWYIIEINDRPGVPARFMSPAVKEFHDKLASCIIEAATNEWNKALTHDHRSTA